MSCRLMVTCVLLILLNGRHPCSVFSVANSFLFTHLTYIMYFFSVTELSMIFFSVIDVVKSIYVGVNFKVEWSKVGAEQSGSGVEREW